MRLVRFSFNPGKHSEAVALAKDLVPQIRELAGCSGAYLFGDEASREYGLVVLWDSQADADAAAEVIGPQLSSHLAGNVQAPADIRLFEVISG